MYPNTDLLQQIKHELQDTLEKPISEPCCRRITQIDKRRQWCDAVTAQGNRNEHVVDIGSGDKLNAYISSRLAHIIVNPSNRKEDATALIETYVYAEQNSNAVNRSTDAIADFLHRLCEVSIRNKGALISKNEFDKAYYTNKDSIKLLVGDRGVGKTFFLNHVLAKFSDYFDKKKIIWVRLNLVDSFGANNDLIWWMYAQASKIILRYYCAESKCFDTTSKKEPIDVFSFIRSYVEDIEDESHKRATIEALQELKDVFVTNSTDEPISPSLFPKGLARKIWESAVRVGGYSFIVVLDGMDRLESSIDSFKKFSALVSGLTKLADSTEAFPASFVVACRRKTADRLAAANAFPYASSAVEKVELGEVDFERVFDLRIKFLSNQIQKFQQASGEDGEIIIEKMGLNRFRAHISKDQQEFSMFGKNMRASMQAVQLRHKEFVSYGLDDSDSHGYRWVESCVKMGWRFPPRVYVYKSNDDPMLPYVCSARESTYDNRLLVSIFSYPYFEFEDNQKIIPSFENCLVGLRVLQVATSSCALFESKKIRSRVTVEFLAEILTDCFGYPGKLTRAVIREFSEFELIDTESNQLVDSNMPNNNAEVHITAKGKYVLNHCLSDVAYLAMCAMRVPMDAQILVAEEDRPPFFDAYAFRTNRKGGSVDGDLYRWVRTKALNSLNFYKLLEYFDSIQIASVRGNASCIANQYGVIGRTQAWKAVIFSEFITRITPISTYRPAILSQVYKMVESIAGFGDAGEQIYTFLTKNKRAWWEPA